MTVRLIRTHDALRTLDASRIDGAAVFLLGELERLDRRINLPLQDFTWGRDVPVRSDVTISDETTSYTRDFFASPGNQRADGKHWIASETNEIAGVQESRSLLRNPLHPWAIEVKYSIFDLERSQAVGRPIDQTKIMNAQRIYQGELNEFAYAGDATLGTKGILNLDDIPVTAAGAKTEGGTAWTEATSVDEIRADINALIKSTLESANEAVAPSRILMPWNNYSVIATRNASEGSDTTILNYIKQNNISNDVSGRQLEIYPCRWCGKAGAGQTARMIAYTPDEQYVRLPVVPLMRTPLDQRGLFFSFLYYGTIGSVENVYPETVGYMDGI
ncbi:MAG: DUF2184 domain-containing protein [Synergistaceae bacterium]|jgi:hypothetical protein|nr:DUF2184 domain-containing protein [Synergistaceae bacterium]